MKFTKEQINKFGLDTSFVLGPMLINKLNAFTTGPDKVLALNDSEFTIILNNADDNGHKRFNWNGHYLLLRTQTRTLIKEKFRGAK